ncbi:uncharacterized protein LOC119084610 isoform X1 [Bradysia coprophila]|uniref:uncharacterized protein LOC119084610 isoform X1 n=1 Tax=Bradysia coprophila TaxID=38358 RepID=UPI00187DBBA8|nr:uncharacterized protein LOC119084610 isoform X1 [Bradysia coprophila]
MEVAMMENSSSPFQREVREWQRVDPNTGALLTGRLEADRWNNGSDNKYGKVIDSQNVSTPNGTQLSQRKELEVLQARTTAGSLQVVRSSTIQTSSSRRSILSMSGNNDTNATVSNDNRSISNISSLVNDRNSSNSLFKTNWNGGKSPFGYERGRSASTEDVTLEQLRANSSDSDDDEPMEWRRVSKIRRSLQYPKSMPKLSTRPTDLPANLVNISKIKRDFESGFSSGFLKPTQLKLSSPSSDDGNETNCKSVKKASFITADSLRDIRGKLKRLSDESLYKDDILASPVESINSINDEINTSSPSLHSSEAKVKYRETNTALTDWHLRRKSYGFENMPADGKEMSKMESSTDSGLGRSGDIWSSMENSKPRGTIITLGDNENNSSSVLLNRDTSDHRLSPNDENGYENKRHSIAVDETKYVKDSKTLVNLNGLHSKEWNSSSSNLLDENGRRMKRVEFCKTEVHFAAESGRVNIVETDGKPPSTNNFRRRRRISAPSSAMETAPTGPLMHFGDEKMFDRNVEKPIESEVKVLTNGQTGGDDVTTTSTINGDEDNDLDEISLRGILKNKPIKPRPYHLGENIESSQKLWGVRLKPTGSDIIKSNDENDGSIFSRNETKDDVKQPIALGYSTKVKLNSDSPVNFSWDNQTLDKIPSSNSRSPSHDNSVQPLKSPVLSHSQSNDLKSTSLIMKTIKSATQFDEAMKSLSACDRSSLTPDKQPLKSDQELGLGSSFKLVSSLNSSKSSSSSSILFEDYSKEENAASSAISFENDSSAKSIRNNRGNVEEASDVRKPIAAPRIKKIGPSTELSLQLSQLRRIYEAADQSVENGKESGDVGDSHLNGIRNQPDEYTTELSGSWSRMKARRNMIKQQHQQFGHENSAEEQFNSNKMSITLHSPVEGSKRIEIPIAKPRASPFVPVPVLDQSPDTKSSDYDSEPVPFRRDNPRKNFTIKFTDKQILSKNESFKPANGARKLKEHELSYFGLNVTAGNNNKPSNESPKNRHDGKLTSDKPDLLINHSPNVERSPKSTIDKSKISTETNNPIYENVKAMKGYDRKLDLKRDEMILKELNAEADEVAKDALLKRVEKEKSPKRHRQSKPFDTIEEEKEKMPKKQMESKAVQVSRGFNETLTRIKPLSRVSSASSSESVSSAGRTHRVQSSHKSLTRTSSGTKSVRDASKCSRTNGHSSKEGHLRSSHGSRSSRQTNSSSHENSVEDVRARQNGHSSREAHLRSSHGSRSSRQTNSSSHENSVEDVRAIVVAPRRIRRSNGTEETANERESQRKLERKLDHHRTSSSSRLTNGERASGSRSSNRSKELASSKEKVKSSTNETDKKPNKTSVTTTTTTHSIKLSHPTHVHHHREKSSRIKLLK